VKKMVEYKYLKWKNKIFKEVLKLTIENGEYENITYLVGNELKWDLPFIDYFNPIEEQYYFDLLGIEFSDEEGNVRKMVMPVPLLSIKTIKKIQKLLDIGAIKVAYRQKHKEATDFPSDEEEEDYPPSFDEEGWC